MFKAWQNIETWLCCKFTTESVSEKVRKSVNIWWSYGQEFGVLFFWLTVYTLYICIATRKWRVLKVTFQVATPGAESAVCDCLVVVVVVVVETTTWRSDCSSRQVWRLSLLTVPGWTRACACTHSCNKRPLYFSLCVTESLGKCLR